MARTGRGGDSRVIGSQALVLIPDVNRRRGTSGTIYADLVSLRVLDLESLNVATCAYLATLKLGSLGLEYFCLVGDIRSIRERRAISNLQSLYPIAHGVGRQ